MGNSAYDEMTMGQLLKAAAEGDQGAIAYRDSMWAKQIEEMDQFFDSHNMDLYTEALKPFYEAITGLMERFQENRERYGRELRSIAQNIDEFYKLHGDALEAISNKGSDKLKKFCNGLTVDDFKEALDMELTPDQVKAFKADRQKFVLELSIGQCIALYEYKRQHETIPAHKVKAVTPKEFVAATDKVSGLSFSIENEKLYTAGMLSQVSVERKGARKEISTLLSLSYDDLEKRGIQLDMKRLTPFDREVHDAITTLYAEGKTDVMSLDMVYRAMTGNPGAKLNPRQREAISNSISKMMYTQIAIDATEEARAYGFDDLRYKGNLLYAEMAIASINGNIIEALHILREPILYSYAGRANRIGRVEMKMLNSPVNKTEETIVLQGYLYRRILAMQHGQSKTILYDTIYKQLNIEAPSAGALRKKKNDVRAKIKTILEYWIKEGFIKGYSENKRGQELCSITISLPAA